MAFTFLLLFLCAFHLNRSFLLFPTESEKVGLSKFAIEVFDLGGSKSIRKIWEKYYAEVHGIIFVVDASDEERLAEAKTTLEEATSHPYTRVGITITKLLPLFLHLSPRPFSSIISLLTPTDRLLLSLSLSLSLSLAHTSTGEAFARVCKQARLRWGHVSQRPY